MTHQKRLPKIGKNLLPEKWSQVFWWSKLAVTFHPSDSSRWFLLIFCSKMSKNHLLLSLGWKVTASLDHQKTWDHFSGSRFLPIFDNLFWCVMNPPCFLSVVPIFIMLLRIKSTSSFGLNTWTGVQNEGRERESALSPFGLISSRKWSACESKHWQRDFIARRNKSAKSYRELRGRMQNVTPTRWQVSTASH